MSGQEAAHASRVEVVAARLEVERTGACDGSGERALGSSATDKVGQDVCSCTKQYRKANRMREVKRRVSKTG